LIGQVRVFFWPLVWAVPVAYIQNLATLILKSTPFEVIYPIQNQLTQLTIRKYIQQNLISHEIKRRDGEKHEDVRSMGTFLPLTEV